MSDDEIGQSWETWRRFVLESIKKLDNEVDKIKEKLVVDKKMSSIDKDIELLKLFVDKIEKEKSVERKIELIAECRGCLDFIDDSLDKMLYSLLEENTAELEEKYE